MSLCKPAPACLTHIFITSHWCLQQDIMNAKLELVNKYHVQNDIYTHITWCIQYKVYLTFVKSALITWFFEILKWQNRVYQWWFFLSPFLFSLESVLTSPVTEIAEPVALLFYNYSLCNRRSSAREVDSLKEVYVSRYASPTDSAALVYQPSVTKPM